MTAPISTCLVCNQAMITVELDQLTHPCCDPDDTRQQVLSETEITALIGDLGWCNTCGDPIRGPALIKRCQPNHKAATP